MLSRIVGATGLAIASLLLSFALMPPVIATIATEEVHIVISFLTHGFGTGGFWWPTRQGIGSSSRFGDYFTVVHLLRIGCANTDEVRPPSQGKTSVNAIQSMN